MFQDAKGAIPSTFGWSPEAVPRRTPQKRTVTVPSDSYEGNNKKSSTSTSSTAEINLTNPTSVKKIYCDEKPSQDEDIEGTDSAVVRSKYFKREGYIFCCCALKVFQKRRITQIDARGYTFHFWLVSRN
ncbi:uncharacterized protein [Argopecten irradians]|uniref:uncharacterized protein n=1 Tax=Argopecten irradians TaxID=31199 RepID=UPI0037165A75